MSETRSNVSWLQPDRRGSEPVPSEGDLALMQSLAGKARRHWKLLFGLMVLALLAGALVTAIMPETYRATARMEIAQQSALASNPADVSLDEIERQRVYLQTQYELMRTPSLAESVSDALDLPQDAAFRARTG